MNSIFKSLLRLMGIYHPLQQFYRRSLLTSQHRRLKKKFKGRLGSGLVCNVCKASYQSFAPRYPSKKDRNALEKNKVIAGYGENVYCPNCMSTARERLVIAMLDKIDLQSKKILHLSPEEKVYQYLIDKANVVTADLNPGFYKNIDHKVMQADLNKLPYAVSSFDIVIGNHIMEHIPDDRKAISEIYRILKSGGVAILQVPFSISNSDTIEDPFIKDPKKQSELFGQKDHVRIYNLENYINRLKKAGFSVQYFSYESMPELHSFAVQPHEGFLYITK